MHNQEKSYMLPGPEDEQDYPCRSDIFRTQDEVETDIPGSSTSIFPYNKYY